jgi:hypothetical protein
MSMTLIADRKTRTADQHARRAMNKDRLLEQVRGEALRLTVDDKALKAKLLPHGITAPIFDTLPSAKQISILENYIDEMKQVAKEIQAKLGAGYDLSDQFDRLDKKINAAAGEISRLIILEAEQGFSLEGLGLER